MEEIMTNQESENTRVWQPNVNALPAIVRANMNLSMTPSQRRHRQHIVERAIADMVRHGETDETTVGQAIFARNRTVEERLGIELKWKPCNSYVKGRLFRFKKS